MRFSRILKLLVPLTLLMVTLTRIEINQLREIFNFSVGKGNLLLLTLIYLLLLTLYLVVYDLLIMKFDSFVSGNLDKFGKKLVQKERGEPAMRIIRIGYLWEMIYRFLRLGWISYGLQIGGVYGLFYLKHQSLKNSLVCLKICLACR